MPICARHTLADLTPKYPTLATSTPGWARGPGVVRAYGVRESKHDLRPKSPTPLASALSFFLFLNRSNNLQYSRKTKRK